MILIIDDDASIRLSLRLLLERNGFKTNEAASPAQAKDLIRFINPELVLLDMNFSSSTSGAEGLTLLRQILLVRPGTPVILMTAWGTIPLAVEGIHAGAFDFITKPWDNAALLQRIKVALQLSGDTEDEPEPTDESFDRSGIIGESAAMLGVLDTVRRVARTDAPVLIMGENGTGKELIAEAIHRNSLRSAAPMVKVNLGGIATSLFESEMFGHRKGSFTGAVADRDGRFALADRGTIFLDEIGDLDLNCQVKLLRVLQEHTYERLGDSRPRHTDVRVVCATNADLPAMVAERTFREDLFYRINLITITIPPLRERTGDIPLLVNHIVSKHCAATKRRQPLVTADALDFLSLLPYPGNVRELRNLIERTLLINTSDRLTADDFCAQYTGEIPPEARARGQSELDTRERMSIEQALSITGGNLSRAAALLGITRQTLYRRLEKYGIQP